MRDQGSPEREVGLAIVRMLEHGRARLRCDGEFDLATAPRFHEALEAMLAEAPDGLEVDLTGVRFMGAEALHAMSEAAARCERLGIGCRIVVNEHGRRLIELSGLEQRLPWEAP